MISRRYDSRRTISHTSMKQRGVERVIGDLAVGGLGFTG
jgi:hypothetical protein